MKKVPLYVKYFSIQLSNAEEFEDLTDQNLHNTPINNLNLTLLNSFNISSKTIENLQSLYPNSITINDFSILSDESTKQTLFENLIKLLSKLDQTSLNMHINEWNYSFELKFSDVIFKVVESKEECSYIKAKSVEISCLDEELCWIK